MCKTNGEGVAVCRCGSELHVVCSGGCTDPDVVFKSERAAIRKPAGREVPNSLKRKVRRFIPGFLHSPRLLRSNRSATSNSRKYTANRKVKLGQRVAA